MRWLLPMILAATPAVAHHSRAMFEMGRNITYHGVVQEYRWENPHSHLIVTVAPGAKDAATVGTWDIEASAIGLMTSRGWTRETFQTGERITVVAHPNRDGSNNILLFYVVMPDGKRLYRAEHRYDGEVE